jgi:hypothetical protein
VTTGKPVRSFRVPQVERAVGIAGSQAVLRLGPTIFTLDIRNGHRHVIARYPPTGYPTRYGPWVSRGRVWWVDSYDQGRPAARSVIRSAPLPGPGS